MLLIKESQDVMFLIMAWCCRLPLLKSY